MSQIFNDERNLFRNRINQLQSFGTDKSSIDALIKSQLNPKDDPMGKQLSELYSMVGIDKFFDIVEMMESIGTSVIIFPTVQSLNEKLLQVLKYYQEASGKTINIDSIKEENSISSTKLQNTITEIKNKK